MTFAMNNPYSHRILNKFVLLSRKSKIPVKNIWRGNPKKHFIQSSSTLIFNPLDDCRFDAIRIDKCGVKGVQIYTYSFTATTYQQFLKKVQKFNLIHDITFNARVIETSKAYDLANLESTNKLQNCITSIDKLRKEVKKGLRKPQNIISN